MGHASLVVGHLFNGRDLVEAVPASVLEVLTPKALEDYLRKKTKYLDLEWFSHYIIHPDNNLRKKEGGLLFQDELLGEERYLVGYCVADLDENCSVLRVREVSRPSDSELIEIVVGEFRQVFTGRSWGKSDLSEHLVSPLYSRSINGRRTDYPIIGVEKKS